MKCDICQCQMYEEDQRFKIVAIDYHVCALCGASSEKLGYRLAIA